MTVGELGRRMSSVEFGDWMRFAEVEPFGPLNDGAMAAAFLNFYRDRKVRSQDFTAAEALRIFAHDHEPPRLADLGSKLRDWAARTQQRAQGRGRVIKRPR